MTAEYSKGVKITAEYCTNHVGDQLITVGACYGELPCHPDTMDAVADEDADGGFIAVHMDAVRDPSFGPIGLVAWNASRQGDLHFYTS